MKHTGEKISPCNTPRSMLNGSNNMLSPLGCLTRTTPVAAVETLSMRSHVNSLCSRAHLYLRNISKIRHLLDRRTTATLVRAYVTSRLDNGNILLGGLPQTLLSKVQRVQNAAARLVFLTGRREHITPVMKELHWLPVRQRISFKVLVPTHQTLHGTAPQYMTDLLFRYQPKITTLQ